MDLFPNSTVVVQWVIFATVFLVLTRLLFRPILKTLELRASRIQGLSEEADVLIQRAAEKLAEYERRMGEARAAAHEKRDEIIRQALKEREALLKEAKVSWEETIGQIRSELAMEMKKMALALKGEAQGLAKDLVRKVLP